VTTSRRAQQDRSPALTVVVATHNRANLLARCLDALQNQSGIHSEDLDVVVIDNRSTDDTKAVVEAFAGRAVDVRYLFEPTLGLSVARNTGLAAARAPVVAYVDDDAFAEPQWAEAVLTAFDSHDSGLAVVAGRVYPEWEVAPPVQMTPYLEALYTVHDRGDKPRLMKSSEYFVGANMAFRRTVLQELGGFEARLGRIGSSLLSNEETHLRDRLAALGYQCAYAPRAVVHHHIGKDRLTPEYIRKRLLAQGESDVIGASLKAGPGTLVTRLSRCFLDAARIIKHSVMSWIPRKRQAVEYSRQLSIVALGRLTASVRNLFRSDRASHV
jgi:glycosyltransferase involved in cell wall biosynthesis